MSDTIGRYNVILELITESKKTNEGVNSIKQNVGGLSTLFKTAAAGFAGIFSVQAIQGINSKIFEITKKYQQYATILKVATGSQQAAAQTMKLIEDTARETTFSVDELTSSYIMMINRGFKPTKQEIIAIADLAASQGRSFADLTQAMLNATTGEYEMLKGFGIKVSSVGDKLNLSFKGMNQTIEKTPEAMQKAILALGQMKGVAGSNAEQMNTLNGILSNMGDNAEKIWKNIGERLKKFYTENLSGIASMVEWLSKITEIPLEEKIQEEQDSLNGLIMTITDVNTGQETRAKLMTELNEKYPFFLEYIGDENASNDQLKKGLKEINGLYIKRLMLVGSQKEIEVLSQKQADLEREKFDKDRERRKDLAKINRELSLGLDLTKYDNVVKAAEAVQNGLLKLISTPGAKNKSKAQWYLEAYDKDWIESVGKTRTKKIKETEAEVQEAWDDFYAMEKELGVTLADIEKVFNAGTEDDKTPTGGGTGTGGKGKKTKADIAKEEIEKEKLEKEVKAKEEADKKKKAAEAAAALRDKLLKERQQKELEEYEFFIERNFYLQEKYLRDTIKNEEELTKELDIVEIDRQMSLLAIKMQYQDKNTGTYINMLKDYDQLSRKYAELTLRVKRDITEPLSKLPTKGMGVTKTKEQLEKEAEDMAKSIKEFVDKMNEENKGDKEKKSFLATLLGVDNEQADLLQENFNNIKNAVLDTYDLEIRKIDELIAKQQERYDKAKALAEKGKVDQLNIEEARLNALTEKREKYEKQQRVISSMQIVTAQSVAAAEAIKGAVQSFSDKPGIVGIVEGTAYLLALGAAILSIRNSVSSAFSDIPGYAEGVNAYGVSDNGLVAGKGTGKSDSNLAKLSKGERVVPEEVNKKIGYDFPNAKLPEAIHAYRILPSVLAEIRGQEKNIKQLDELKKEMVAVRQSIESIKIVTKLDKDGFIQNIERSFDEAVRRKKIMG